MLDWDESELVAAFEAAPTYEEDGDLYTYSVSEAGVRVDFGVWPSHGEVSVSVHVGDGPEPAYWSGFVPCTAVRRRREANGAEAIEVRKGERVVLVVGIRPRLKVVGPHAAV